MSSAKVADVSDVSGVCSDNLAALAGSVLEGQLAGGT
jgi:hypothetical protein